jgi:hypothetical protein
MFVSGRDNVNSGTLHVRLMADSVAHTQHCVAGLPAPKDALQGTFVLRFHIDHIELISPGAEFLDQTQCTLRVCSVPGILSLYQLV